VVQDALHKARKKDRELLAVDLKKMYRAETEPEAKSAPLKLREQWGEVYPEIVERQESKVYALLAFFASSQTYPVLSLHHEPTGTVNQRGKAADRSY
jgi:transposase-like protein